MFRNSVIRLFMATALIWRLWDMMYFNSRFIDPTLTEIFGEISTEVENGHAQIDSLIDTPKLKAEEDAPSTSKKNIGKGIQSHDFPSHAGVNPQQHTTTTKQGRRNDISRRKNNSTVDLDHWQKPSRSQATVKNALTEDNLSDPSLAISSPSLYSIRNSCFEFNSDEWIFGNISSNKHDGITPELLDTLMEGPVHFRKLPSLFDQTICHTDSPLRSFIHRIPSDVGSVDYLASVENWYQRFFYLALHWKFHRPALQEYQSRKNCAQNDSRSLESFMDHHEIRPMDFECRDAKFVIIPIGSVGFGAFLNTQASLCIILALSTNRIPIFSSRSYFYWQKRKGDHDPWLLAPSNCSRKDMQCYFLPTSPCTVTIQDLEKAPTYGVTRQEQQFLRDELKIPPELEKERVVVLNPGLIGTSKRPPYIAEVIHATIDELLSEWKRSRSGEGDPLLRKDWEAIDLAHQWILKKCKVDPDALLRQVYVYVLRPNPHYKDLLNQQMSRIETQTIHPSETIGLAIRGSDKCKKESTCLPFDRYMEFATNIVYPTLTSLDGANSFADGNNRPKLIMTTEDPKIFEESLTYQHNKSFPFQFLVNEDDNMQGSGYPRDFASGEAEKTIVSSLTALKFHFNAGKVFLNCCSNFHIVLNNLIRGQCGARRHGHDFVFGTNVSYNSTSSPSKVAHCLSEDGIPRRYRMCCSWTKESTICRDIWSEYLKGKEKQTRNKKQEKNNFEKLTTQN